MKLSKQTNKYYQDSLAFLFSLDDLSEAAAVAAPAAAVMRIVVLLPTGLWEFLPKNHDSPEEDK